MLEIRVGSDERGDIVLSKFDVRKKVKSLVENAIKISTSLLTIFPLTTPAMTNISSTLFQLHVIPEDQFTKIRGDNRGLIV